MLTIAILLLEKDYLNSFQGCTVNYQASLRNVDSALIPKLSILTIKEENSSWNKSIESGGD